MRLPGSKSFILLNILFLIFSSSILSQTKGDFSSRPFPVVYGKKTDGFPNKIKLEGTIVDASPAPFYCGTLAVAGTLKIKLSQKLKGYRDEFLYAVVLCFAVEKKEDLIDQKIAVEAVKLEKYPYKFGVSVTNNIDSKGIPFYQLQGIEGVGGLLKSLKANQNKQ